MRQMITILPSLLFLFMGFSFLIGMFNAPKSKRYKQMMTLTGIGFVLFISSVFVGQIRFTSKPKIDDSDSQEVEVPQSTPIDIIVEEPKVEVPAKETPVETPKEDKEAENNKLKEAEALIAAQEAQKIKDAEVEALRLQEEKEAQDKIEEENEDSITDTSEDNNTETP